MPNRILKESICTSESIDSLTAYQEVFFYRLIVNCDDYGRMDGRPRVLASKLFPLCDYNENLIIQTVQALEKENLITHYIVDGKPYIQMNTWDKHQQVRAKKSKYPSPSNITCNQLIADDYKCPRNPIQSLSESESESVSESELTDSDAHAIQREQDVILTAAENAGFNKSPMSRAKIVELYAENGKDKMLNAINECVRYGVTNLAYLEAVLRGGPRKAKPRVAAQDFEQRSYDDVQKQLEEETAAHVIQMLKDEGEWDYEHNCSKGTWKEGSG
ncbi:MAG: hypothetical protein K6F61_04045 [Clostridiales bacterium]|nr:hypothetical protein [Clostridiales bacterium]